MIYILFNKKTKSIISFIIINSLLCNFSFNIKTINAKTKSQIQNEINKKQKELENNKKKIVILEDKKKAINEEIQKTQLEINNLNNQINSISNEITTLETKIAKLEKEIEILNQEIETKEKEIEFKEKELIDNLQYDYINNSTFNYIEVLFSSSSISNFFQRLEIINMLVNKKTQLINEIQQKVEELNKQKKELEIKKIETTTLKKSREKVLAQLQILEDKKQQEIQKLYNEQRSLNNAIEDIMDISEQLESQIKNLIRELQKLNEQKRKENNQNIVSEKGFIKPTYGVLTSPFGMRMHPIYKEMRFHKGIDIANKMGTPIYASKSGIVIFAGYMGGYGNTVIIDHGNGVSTLYAHCSSLLVGINQEVKQGQTIALMGSTGASTGPHLHFEIRINGEPVNPLNYINL